MAAPPDRDLDWHLSACAGCGAANGLNAVACWRCNAPLAAMDAQDDGAPVDDLAPPPLAAADHERPPAAPSELAGRPPLRRGALVALSVSLAVAFAASALGPPPGTNTTPTPRRSAATVADGRVSAVETQRVDDRPLDSWDAPASSSAAVGAAPASAAAAADDCGPAAALGLCDHARKAGGKQP